MSTVSSTQSSIAAPPALGLAPYATRQVRLLLSISSNAFRSLCFSIALQSQSPFKGFQSPWTLSVLQSQSPFNGLSLLLPLTFNVFQ